MSRNILKKALNGEFLGLKSDFYGLIEIENGDSKIHALIPRIEKFAKYIKRFDYLALRWQAYPLYAGRHLLETSEDEERFLHFVWKAQRVSVAARRYVKENFWKFLWVINNT